MNNSQFSSLNSPFYNRLELNWVGKYDPQNRIKPEPRILVENPEFSYSVDKGQGTADSWTNMLIHGDNLLSLKSLEHEFAGKIRCIAVDVPYNTQNAFTHYDDGLEHSTWLSLMQPRLQLLKNLLSKDGSIWICIDDDEQAYLKVLCDEVFGRKNFINTIIWEKKYTVSNDAKWFSDNHDFILVYAKNKDLWRPNKLARTAEMNAAYKNPDKHPKGVWKSTPLHAKSGSSSLENFSYTFKNGVVWIPPTGTYPRFSSDTLTKLDNNDEIWFGKDGKAIPSRKTFLCELKNDGTPSRTVWRFDDVGHNHEARDEVRTFNNKSVFSTPKPERLIERILTLATNPGDIVVDSFLGSGTTSAVAHKMGRRWIGIELGNHAYTHCYPRLKAVVDGEQGGISKAVGWKGGGGFKFYELAPSLLEKDKFGNYVISKEYNADMLAAAMAKHEGYTYSPNENIVWKQGYSGEKNFIFTTTGTITPEYLDYIATELSHDEYLLICAKSFDVACLDRHTNIIIHQIPKILLGKCEFDKANYNLNIIEDV